MSAMEKSARSSEEASEQSGLGRYGVCGAKGRGQGECGSAKHGPDAEPGGRIKCADPHTRCRYQEQTGQADGAPASHQHRCSAGELLRSEEVRCAGCRRVDVGRLRGEHRGQPRKSCSHRSVSSVAIAPDVHTEGGWQTTAARHRRIGKAEPPLIRHCVRAAKANAIVSPSVSMRDSVVWSPCGEEEARRAANCAAGFSLEHCGDRISTRPLPAIGTSPMTAQERSLACTVSSCIAKH